MKRHYVDLVEDSPQKEAPLQQISSSEVIVLDDSDCEIISSPTARAQGSQAPSEQMHLGAASASVDIKGQWSISDNPNPTTEPNGVIARSHVLSSVNRDTEEPREYSSHADSSKHTPIQNQPNNTIKLRNSQRRRSGPHEHKAMTGITGSSTSLKKPTVSLAVDEDLDPFELSDSEIPTESLTQPETIKPSSVGTGPILTRQRSVWNDSEDELDFPSFHLSEPASPESINLAAESQNTQDDTDTETSPVLPVLPASETTQLKRQRKTNAPRAAKRQSTSIGRGIKVMTDRKQTAKEMSCILWSDTEDWSAQLRPALEDLDINVQIDASRPVIPNVALVVSMERSVGNQWDSEQLLFVPADVHKETEDHTIIILEFKGFEDMAEATLQEQRDYFDRIESALGSPKYPIYLVPGVARREHRSAMALNRQVRRRVNAANAGDTADWSPLSEPVKFSDVEVALEVLLGVRALYPMTDQSCIEWITNLVVDTSFRRYKSKYSEMGASGKSGSSTRECSVEILSQIQSVAPRMASKIADRYINVAGMLSALKADRPQRVFSGIFGDTIGLSIAAVMTCDDPDQLVTTSHS